MLAMLSAILLASLAPGLLAFPLDARQTTRPFFIHNKCPSAVNLYVGGVLQGPIAKGASVTKVLDESAGFFYTNVNGGATTAEGTVRAGFNGPDIYYLVKDPTYINAGISVAPHNQAAYNGFCPKVECDDVNCAPAYTFPPTGFAGATGSTPPKPPLFRCPVANITFDITFCPTGSFPSQVTAIHPLYSVNKCMDVRGAKFANGTPVQVYDCNGTGAQKWLIQRGSTKVQLAGTNFCLDAGSNPASGVGLKIWQCYANLAAQAWNYSNDNRISLVGKGQCVDLPNGNLANSNQLQTWQCIANNNNQVWNI